MYICICIYIYEYVYICAHMCICIYLYTYMYICVYMCIHVYICMYMCVHVCVRACVCVRARAFVCVYTPGSGAGLEGSFQRRRRLRNATRSCRCAWAVGQDRRRRMLWAVRMRRISDRVAPSGAGGPIAPTAHAAPAARVRCLR